MQQALVAYQAPQREIADPPAQERQLGDEDQVICAGLAGQQGREPVPVAPEQLLHARLRRQLLKDEPVEAGRDPEEAGEETVDGREHPIPPREGEGKRQQRATEDGITHDDQPVAPGRRVERLGHGQQHEQRQDQRPPPAPARQPLGRRVGRGRLGLSGQRLRACGSRGHD